MKFDDVAAHLIYIQAKYFIDTGKNMSVTSFFVDRNIFHIR